MKASLTFVALTLVAAASAHAFPADAKKLARFDMGYARCELKFEQMRGHRDDAYLALWKMQADEKSRLLKIKIEEILGGHLASERPTQTI